VLESFLAFRKPSVQGKDRLYSMLEATNFDSVKKTKILRFMHVHSHEDLGTQEHDPSVLTETPQIMTALLELIESEDQGHYEEMMKVVNPAGSAAVLQKATA
jgi:wobble nucleotide-excising tRNase